MGSAVTGNNILFWVISLKNLDSSGETWLSPWLRFCGYFSLPLRFFSHERNQLLRENLIGWGKKPLRRQDILWRNEKPNIDDFCFWFQIHAFLCLCTALGFNNYWNRVNIKRAKNCFLAAPSVRAWLSLKKQQRMHKTTQQCVLLGYYNSGNFPDYLTEKLSKKCVVFQR